MVRTYTLLEVAAITGASIHTVTSWVMRGSKPLASAIQYQGGSKKRVVTSQVLRAFMAERSIIPAIPLSPED